MRTATLLNDPVQEHEFLLDWLPWHHTFGGNAVLNTTLFQASTFYLDDGKPLPSEFAKTIRNTIDVRPTQFLSVPAAFAVLAHSLETNPALCTALFSRIKLFAYGGAALGQDIFERIQKIAVYNARTKAVAARIKVVKFLTDPPSMDANEITNKHYINQATVLANRPQMCKRFIKRTPIRC